MYDKNVFVQLYSSIFCKWSGAIFARMYDRDKEERSQDIK